jgi:hypothetical protein
VVGSSTHTKSTFYADSSRKPAVVKVRPENVPATLTALDQWVTWRLEWMDREKKWNKPPINPRTGQYAKSTDPTTWSSFDVAMSRYERGHLDGIGFVFTPTDPFVGIDLDDAMTEPGVLYPWSKEIVENLRTYTEVSPSMTGAKVFVRGRLPDRCAHKKRVACGEIEVYDRARYFTITGNTIANAIGNAIEDRQQELDALLGRFQFVEEPKPVRSPDREPTGDSARLADALRFVGGVDDYDRWLQVGMALHSWRPADGFALWCNWSTSSPKFNEEVCRDKWRGFKTAGGVTVATVFEFAKQGGWVNGDGARNTDGGCHNSAGSGRAVEDGHQAGPRSDPGFRLGSLTIRPAPPRRTESGKTMVQLTVLRAGQVVDSVPLNDTAGGRRSAAALIAKHEEAGDKEQVERFLTSVLAWAVEQLNRPPESAVGDTVLSIVAARVPEMLGLTYRTARGLWSEAEGCEMRRADLMGFVPTEMLITAAAGCDAPKGLRPLLGAVKDALEVVWADLRQSLKPAAELKEDTPARRAFHDAVVRIWKTTRTWEVDRGKDRMTASRVSLAGMVERASHSFVSCTSPPERRQKWKRVREDVDAWWRPTVMEDGRCSVHLAMRHTLAEQVGVTVPEAEDQKRFTELGLSYGVFTDAGCVSGRLSDGTRLSVLAQPVSERILAAVEDDADELASTDAEAAQ